MYAFSALLNMDSLCSKVYIVDEVGGSSRHPTPGEIPWPVLISLTAFNKKHIPLASRFKEHAVREATRKFERKLGWLEVYKDQPSRSNPYNILRVASKYKVTPPLSSMPSTEHKAVCTEFRKLMDKCITNAKHAMRHIQPASFFFSYSRSVLQDIGYNTFVTDKDGGYTLVKSDLCSQIFSNIVSNGDYGIVQ